MRLVTSTGDAGVRRACPPAKGVRDHPRLRGDRATMTSSENETASETLAPRAPGAAAAVAHARTGERCRSRPGGSRMDEVLPVANELDPQKGRDPGVCCRALAELGYFGITHPAPRTAGLGLGAFEYCMVTRGARPRLDDVGEHHRAGAGPAAPPPRRRSAARELLRAQRPRRMDRCDRAVRAGRRLRPGRRPDPRRPRG